MKLTEILNESVSFMPAILKIEGGKKIYSLDAFEKKIIEPCGVCNGQGYEVYKDEKYKCGYCEGKKEWARYEIPMELNIANANLSTILSIMGLPDNNDYSGHIDPEDMPEIRRRLIKIKNGDLKNFTQEPTKFQGSMRHYKDEIGIDHIDRGPVIYDMGRTSERVMGYIDGLLKLIDFAQKNNAYIIWS